MRNLTEKETQVLRTLAKAWVEFLRLPVVHDMDNPEFIDAIHRAQCLILARPAADELRENPLVL